MRANHRRSLLHRGVLLAVTAVVGMLLAACTGGGAAPSAAAPSVAASATAGESPAPVASDPPATADASSGGGRGDYDYDYETGTGASPAPGPAGPGAIVVNTATGPIGTWLTGVDGLTLYTFTPDSANASTCVDDCATAWPPFTIEADDTLESGDGVDGELTTFERPDGTLQVAYDGAPLYYFASDTAPGDTNGQGLGDKWFAAEP
jgi:predicted lipoprotein with Yx(FWY)xxD motif